MNERFGPSLKAIGVLVGSDGESAIAYKQDTSGLVTTLPHPGFEHGVGRLPDVKREARRLARAHNTTILIPRRR